MVLIVTADEVNRNWVCLNVKKQPSTRSPSMEKCHTVSRLIVTHSLHVICICEIHDDHDDHDVFRITKQITHGVDLINHGTVTRTNLCWAKECFEKKEHCGSLWRSD